MKILAIVNIIIIQLDWMKFFKLSVPFIIPFYTQIAIILIIVVVRRPLENNRVLFFYCTIHQYSFWGQALYFLIFEIFKYKRAPNFYYGHFGQESYHSNTVFWTFLGSFCLIAYIYIIALLNCRVCKSELDIMKIFLDQA